MITLTHGTFFIGGIDTGIGKSVVTGFLAKTLIQSGTRVITQKMVQTGGSGISEDLFTHRRIMGFPLQEVDYAGLTCPYIFSHPSSPHLAARLENTTIRADIITTATQKLAAQYDVVLIEGAGGLMVPLTDSMLIIDYLAKQGYPLLLVTSPRLGSINQTLLNLELCKNRSINLIGLIYNLFGQTDAVITDETRIYLIRQLNRLFPAADFIEIPMLTLD